LAGILLKLGGYGFIRFMLPLLPYANYFYTPFIFTIATVAVLYTSLTAIRQVDLKKIIAYASVSHMNFVVLGLLTSNVTGILGSVFLMLSHGIVSSGLFFSVGVVYERYHTRLLRYYGGLVYTMPIYAVLFFILILANFSFPGSSNFVGEFMVLSGLVFQNPLCALFSLISIVPSIIYSVWSYNRFFFGFSSNQLLHFSDVSKREFVILGSLVTLAILFGIFPNLILCRLEWTVFDLF
jgi:NADH-quinone oxidoreductase subunit M